MLDLTLASTRIAKYKHSFVFFLTWYGQAVRAVGSRPSNFSVSVIIFWCSPFRKLLGYSRCRCGALFHTAG